MINLVKPVPPEQDITEETIRKMQIAGLNVVRVDKPMMAIQTSGETNCDAKFVLMMRSIMVNDIDYAINQLIEEQVYVVFLLAAHIITTSFYNEDNTPGTAYRLRVQWIKQTTV